MGSVILKLMIAATSVIAVFVFFIVWFVIIYKRNYNKHFLEKIQLQSQFDQSLLQTQLEIREQTLRTISQEIHDNVGQILSLAKINLATLEFSEGIQKENKISSAAQLVGKAINDLRDLSRSMNGDKISDLGLKDAIDNELKIIRNTGQYNTALKIEGEACRLMPQNEMVVFRIVQESLNNALKHSKAKNITVQLSYTENIFGVCVLDDGKGFDADKLERAETGIGLKNMQSRARLIGARFSIQSVEDSGTAVMLELPNKKY